MTLNQYRSALSAERLLPLGDLTDNFALNDFNFGVWEPYNGSAVTTAHRAEVPMLSAFNAGFVSRHRSYIFTGNALIFECGFVGGDSTFNLQIDIRAADDDNNKCSLIIASSISAGFRVGGVYTFAVDDFPYDATACRWMRIREDSGTVNWDRSSDGVSWTNFASAALVSGLNWDSTSVVFTGGATGAQDGVAWIDSVNLAGYAAPAVLSVDSPWNSLIPPSPTIATNSAAIIATITGWLDGKPRAIAAGVAGTGNDFNIPFYQAQAGDPSFTIDAPPIPGVSTSDPQVNGSVIAIPDLAQPAGGSDGHLVVTDAAGDWVYEFWQVTAKPSGGGTLSASAAGRSRLHGDGFDAPEANAAKTALYAGRVTAEEWKAAHEGLIDDFGHAIAIMVRSTDGTAVWPASGNAGADDLTGTPPPNGTWLQVTYTLAEIDALLITSTAKAILRTGVKYGFVVIDTTGGNGSWTFRSLGNDGATLPLDEGQPMLGYAVAAGEPGEWYADGSIEYYGGYAVARIDWADKLRMLDPGYMKAQYETRLAAKKVKPASDIANAWTLNGDGTAAACLANGGYAPFRPSVGKTISTSTDGANTTVKMGTVTVPAGKTLRALIAQIRGASAAAGEFTVKFKSGSTVLASRSVPASEPDNWTLLSYETDGSDVDLTNLQVQFTKAGAGLATVYDAAVIAEWL